MRAKVATTQTLVLGLSLLATLACGPINASEIKGLQVSSGATGTRAEIALDSSSDFEVIRLTNPDRLAIDLPDSTLAKGLQMPGGSGVVRSVRTGQPSPGTARIVFDLVQSVAVLQPRIEQGVSGPKLVLEWPGDGEQARPLAIANPSGPSLAASVAAGQTPPIPAAPFDGPTEAERAAASAAATTRLISELAARTAQSAPGNSPVAAAPSPANLTQRATGPVTIATGRPAPVASAPVTATPATPNNSQTPPNAMRGRGMRPLIVAIDAGHGGQDPGAVGLASTREKDITLSIARELARQIDATPGLKSYLTRDNDVFIPLNRRAQLARQAKADIFVSIHADAAVNRKAKGSSVYVLSLSGASSQRARWLADKENAADMIGGVSLAKTNNTLASVLLDLTQSGHMKASEDAASHVLAGLKRVGNNHKPQVERANFAVLRTSDMPAMLVETAFLSNPEEEKRLTDPAFQRTIARAVLDGVNTYFTQQPPPGTMYAARAEAQWAGAGGTGAAGGSP